MTKHIHKTSLKWMLTVVLAGFLLACSKPLPQGDPEYQRSLRVAAIENQLEKKGVGVVQIGQTMRLIILSDALFNPHSANFQSKGPSILDTVAQLMIILQTTSAQVAGYTNTEYSEQINKALSARQAQVVVDYLWTRGIDARLMYAVGKGTKEPLVSATRKGGDLNHRIEIQFQYLPLLSTVMN